MLPMLYEIYIASYLPFLAKELKASKRLPSDVIRLPGSLNAEVPIPNLVTGSFKKRNHV